MDCSSWSLAWTGLLLPPFLPTPTPNAGGPDCGGGGGGGPDRVAGGGGGGGGGGNGMTFCTPAPVPEKQIKTIPVRSRRRKITTGGPFQSVVHCRAGCWRTRWCDTVGSCVMSNVCWRHGGAHCQRRTDVCDSRARDWVETTAMTKERKEDVLAGSGYHHSDRLTAVFVRTSKTAAAARTAVGSSTVHFRRRRGR